MLLAGVLSVTTGQIGSADEGNSLGGERDPLSSFRIVRVQEIPADFQAVSPFSESLSPPDARTMNDFDSGLGVWLEGVILPGEEGSRELAEREAAGVFMQPLRPERPFEGDLELLSYDEDRLPFDELREYNEHGLPGASAESPLSADCLTETDDHKPWIVWKSTSLTATWLPGSGDDYGLTDLHFRLRLTSPRVPFLTASPKYQMTFLNGPQRTDVPNTLHQAAVSFMGMLPVSKRWIGQVIVAPGINSDYQNLSSEAWRTTGAGMLIFMPSPEVQWMFGVVYLNRDDVKLLPAVGLNWSPNERTKWELTFPRPRYLRQLSCNENSERWGYLAAEFGGGTWAVERADGTNDLLTLRDYRLLIGSEIRYQEQRSLFWEGGLVIGREINYASQQGDFSQSPTIFLRGGSTF